MGFHIRNPEILLFILIRTPERNLAGENDDKKKRAKESTGCQIRTGEGLIIQVKGGTELDIAAMRWSYIARNRQRWSYQGEARAELIQRACEALITLDMMMPQKSGVSVYWVWSANIPRPHIFAGFRM